jgi:hypothetical protein
MIWFVDSAEQTPTPSPARAAIVSVVIGEAHEAAWRTLSAASWVAYAERIGVDLIVFKDRIDKTDLARSPAWQKLLIPSLPWIQRYERLIWLDSDIIISETAPDILEFAGPPEKVSLSREGSRLSPAEAQIYLERLRGESTPPDKFDVAWRQETRMTYVSNGLPPHDEQFNTGVMVLSPQRHKDLFRSVYDSPEITRLYEQPHLSHRLLQDDLAHVISPRFNWGIIEPIRLYIQDEVIKDEDPVVIGKLVRILMRAELRNGYFLHFYGAMNLLKFFMGVPIGQPAAAAAA